MIHVIYSVYDEKAAAYLPTFNAPTAGAAIRMIMDALGDPEHMLSKHAQDYTLYQLASFDNEAGDFANDKKVLMTILEIKATLPQLLIETQQYTITKEALEYLETQKELL